MFWLFKKKNKFKLNSSEIQSLVENMWWCFATDMITVDGKGVNFMYREKAKEWEVDSGWKFFSWYEDDDYINNPSNTKIYDVNTIANYEQDIIPFLNYPNNVAFERNQETWKFEKIEDFDFPNE